MTRALLASLIFVIGLLLTAYGAALVWLPLGVIVAGVSMAAVGWLLLPSKGDL